MSDKIKILKRLREETALGMAECKNALEEVNYSYDKAITVLREKGKDIANKKLGRSTGQGVVGVKASKTGVSVIELCCETDFVSRGDSFCEIANKILSVALESKANSPEELLKANNGTVKELITSAIAKLGENIKLQKTIYKQVTSGIIYYVHNAIQGHQDLGQIISVILYNSNNTEEAKEIMRLVAMHTAAANPSYVGISDVPKNVIAEEKRIYSEQAKTSNKPATVVQKIIEGRLNKYYQENVLMEQNFVVDPDLKISQAVQKVAKEKSCDILIKDFILIKLVS
ncbi:MAG: translation elongation factor Ts [Alphaproteobacteria bacterium]|nr:translation elongation factor Ts [Rickettsiales bacterium]